MKELSGPEATLQQLVEQLEAFYLDRFEPEPSAPETEEPEEWDELSIEARGLAQKVEALALENVELASMRTELEERCKAAEVQQEGLSSKAEALAVQVEQLERERVSLVDACTTARRGLEVMEAEYGDVLARSKEVDNTLQEAIEMAERLKAEKTELEASYEQALSELKLYQGGRRPADLTPEAEALVRAESARRKLQADRPDLDRPDLQTGATPRIEALESELQDAQEARSNLEASHSQLSFQVGTLEAENRTLQQVLDQTRERMQALITASPVLTKEETQ